LVERIIHGMAESEDRGGPEALPVVGCFAEDAKLIDEIEAAAMTARERDPLRRHWCVRLCSIPTSFPR
jgi:hypothetical protein